MCGGGGWGGRERGREQCLEVRLRWPRHRSQSMAGSLLTSLSGQCQTTASRVNMRHGLSVEAAEDDKNRGWPYLIYLIAPPLGERG